MQRINAILLLMLFISVLSLGYIEARSAPDLVPVANADITLYYNDGSILQVSTDENGEFRGLVRPGLYDRIDVSAPTIETFTLASVNIDSTNNLVELVVNESLWLGGYVTVDGSPGRSILLSGPTTVYADSDGKYAMPLDGVYSFLASYGTPPIDYLGYWRIYSNISGWSEAFGFQLPPYTLIDGYPINPSKAVYRQEFIDLTGYPGRGLIMQNISLQGSLRVSGVITDEFGAPISNAVIYIFPASGAYPGGYAVTDGSGRYVVDVNIAPNEVYNIQVVAEGYIFFNSSFRPSGDFIFDIQLARSTVIRGHVTDANGAPLKDIIVWAASSSGWNAYALTDANGYYELPTGFGVGDEVVIYYIDRGLWMSSGFLAVKDVSFTVQPGDNIVDLVYDIPSITVSGVVDDVLRDGLLESVRIKVQLKSSEVAFPLPSISVNVGGDGSFNFKIPTSIVFFGSPINVTAIDVAVDGWYYYPDTPVASDVPTTSDINLGTISINSYPLIEATIRVYVERSLITLPNFKYEIALDYMGRVFPLTMETNSSLEGVTAIVAPNNGSIVISVVGPTGTEGYLRVTIVKEFLGPPYTIYIDGAQTGYNVLGENATHITIELTYRHSRHNIMITSTQVIPELPITIQGLVIMVLASITIAVFMRKWV